MTQASIRAVCNLKVRIVGIMKLLSKEEQVEQTLWFQYNNNEEKIEARAVLVPFSVSYKIKL